MRRGLGKTLRGTAQDEFAVDGLADRKAVFADLLEAVALVEPLGAEVLGPDADPDGAGAVRGGRPRRSRWPGRRPPPARTPWPGRRGRGGCAGRRRPRPGRR